MQFYVNFAKAHHVAYSVIHVSEASNVISVFNAKLEVP